MDVTKSLTKFNPHDSTQKNISRCWTSPKFLNPAKEKKNCLVVYPNKTQVNQFFRQREVRTGDISPPQCGQISGRYVSELHKIILPSVWTRQFFAVQRTPWQPSKSDISLSVPCELKYTFISRWQQEKYPLHHKFLYGVKCGSGLTLLTFLKYILI